MQITMDTPLRTSSVPRWMVIQVLQSFSREWHLPNSAERSEQISERDHHLSRLQPWVE